MRLTIFFSLFLLVGCADEPLPLVNERHVKYQQFLDGLDLYCPSDSSSTYFKATIAGQEACYYSGIDGRKLYFGITTKFSTPLPTINTGEVPGDARHSARMAIWQDSFFTGAHHVVFDFPEFNLERDTIDYLDSLFSVEYHKIRSDQNESDRFNIELRMIEITEQGGVLGWPISSEFGPSDEEGYIRFSKVEKDRDDGYIYYRLEMEVECGLYHWEQHGQEGLWGRIEDGLFVGRIRVRY